MADYEYAGAQISLADSIGDSLSMYPEEARDGMVEACCVITMADKAAFCQAAADNGIELD